MPMRIAVPTAKAPTTTPIHRNPPSTDFSRHPDRRLLTRLRQLDAIFAIFGAFDRDKCLILQSRG